jgi:hypothetical protein
MPYHNPNPHTLIPSWSVHPSDPLEYKFQMVQLPMKTTEAPKHQDDHFNAHKVTTLGPVYGLRQNVDTTTFEVPYHSFANHIDTPFFGWRIPTSSAKFPQDMMGFILAMFMLVWLSQMLRRVVDSWNLTVFVYNMPMVNSEYRSLKESELRPSQYNHVIKRAGMSEVYAITCGTRFWLCSLMIFKAIFHLWLGFLGSAILLSAPSFADLFVTFLALWFVGTVLPTPLVEAMLPWAMEDVRATKFANYPVARQESYCPSLWAAMPWNCAFFFLSILCCIFILSADYTGAANPA